MASIIMRRLMKSTPTSLCVRKFASEADNQVIERCNATINHVQLLGRVGSAPQQRGTEEHPVVVFSLATNTTYKSKTSDGLEQATDWHRVCVFKPRLKDTVYNYLRKGQRVYVTGRVSYGEIPSSSNSSEKINITSIIAEDVIFFSN